MLAFLLLGPVIPAHAINVESSSWSYSQDFNSLATSSGNFAWANDVTIAGWYLYRQPAPGTAITAYGASTGSSSDGGFYSFGNSSDRALGGLGSGGAFFGNPGSGSVAGWIAVSFVNGSGAVLDGFSASWTGEQWRNGGNTANQTMVFEYGFGTTFGGVTTWTALGGDYDWTSPVTGATAGSVDGNVAGRVMGVGGTVSSIEWADNQTLWLRWVERNDTGNDHGLAIDDFWLTAHSAPAVPDTAPTALLFSIPLLGLFTIRRVGCWCRS